MNVNEIENYAKLQPLSAPYAKGKVKLPNRVCFQPMEGCDCMENGAPSELTVEKYVKAADKFSALIKCREELNLGNKEFASAAKSAEKAIKALKLPAAEVFLKEFVPTFEDGLDESIG